MGNRKGQKHYTEEIKGIVREEYAQGVSQIELHRKYGVSRYTIQSWCGLRKEVNIRQTTPLKRGRPSSKSNTEDLEKKVKRLEMENDLLRNFLRELERK